MLDVVTTEMHVMGVMAARVVAANATIATHVTHGMLMMGAGTAT